MSFFFNKQDSKDNLEYDDTAFMHFTLSVSVISALIFVALIFRDLSMRKKKNINEVRKLEHFRSKLQNTQKMEPSYYSTSAFIVKFAVILISVVIGGITFVSLAQNEQQMIGFDPYEILGVQIDSPILKIKKAYRKLALEFHPDRNQNNPQASAKFIRISKAYECLTDPQAKQKCEKYGNPDGQVSSKVGIGLPHFMIVGSNQYYVLPPIFIFLLIIIPRAFMNWMQKQKPQDENQIYIADYPMMHSYMTPRLNPITCTVIMSLMKDLDPVFPDPTKVLDENFEKGFKAILIGSKAVTEKQLETFTPHMLFRAASVYGYLANRTKYEKLDTMINEVTEKILKFSLFFTQRGLDQKPLLGNPDLIINWFGLEPMRNVVFFTRQMFNPSVRVGDTKSVEFLDLTEEQINICKENAVGNLQLRLLGSEHAIDEFVSKFSQERREYIKKQILCLPSLKMKTRVLLGEEQVTEMTFDDFAMFEIQITKERDTPGYVVCRDFPYLVEEKFIVIVSFNSNLMFLGEISFPNGKKEVTVKFQHRQAVEKQMKFNVNLISLNYPNMDLEGEINVDVLAPIKERKIQIHKEDMNLQKLPKNFFESLASMEAVNESDRELSDSEDDEKEEKSTKKESEEEEQMMGRKKK